RVLRRARAHQQTHRHGRLLVVEHGDDLQSVRQRLELVRRERDVVRRQRPRRRFARPLELLCGGGGRQERDDDRGDRLHCATFSDGTSVSTSRFSARKYLRATRCTSAMVVAGKMSNSPSAVLMSPWITTACASCSAFC